MSESTIPDNDELNIPDNDELNVPDDDESKIPGDYTSSNDELIKTIKQSTSPQRIVAWIIIATLGIFIFYLLFSYLSILMKYKPILDWAHNQGAKEYKNKLNMFNIVAAKSNAILYFISNTIFTPPTAQLTMSQTKFLLDRIFKYQTFVDPDTGDQEGVVTMLSLVKSVLPEFQSTLSPDLKFDDWVTDGKRAGYAVSATTTKPLRYIAHTFTYPDSNDQPDWPGMQNATLYSYTIDPGCLVTVDGKQKAPMWPSPTDTISWTGLIYEWLNGEDSTNNDNVDSGAPAPDPSAKNAPYFYIYAASDDFAGALSVTTNDSISGEHGASTTDNDRFQYWFGKDMNNPQADNWIARMGIPYSSHLILGFINMTLYINGEKMDPQAFKNLIGYTGGDIAGGWVGYAQGMGEGVSLDFMINTLDTTDLFSPPDPPPPCDPTVGSGVTAFTGPFAGSLMFAAPLFAEALPAAIFVIAIGIAQGGLAAAQDGQCP